MAGTTDLAMEAKFMVRPKSFDGSKPGEVFREWKFQMENYLILMDPLFMEELTTSEAMQGTVPTPTAEDTAKRSRTLYAVLAALTSGRALRVVQAVKSRHGYEAWRSLHEELAPRVHARKLGMLQQILKPQFSSTMTIEEFREKYAEWLRYVDHYEEFMGKAMDEEVKIAISVENSPAEVKTWLQVNSDSYGSDFKKLHAVLMTYVDSRRTFAEEPKAMEVDELRKGGKKGKSGKGYDNKKGKGKGKWSDQHQYDKGYDKKMKGKGKYDQQGEKGGDSKDKGYGGKGEMLCFRCGKPGHQARFCNVHVQHLGSPPPASESGGSAAGSASSQQPATPASVSALTAVVEEWVFMAQTYTGAAEESLVLVDSGSMIHVCPKAFYEKLGCEKNYDVQIRAANGQTVVHFGQRTIPLLGANNFPVTVKFEVADVVRPILSVHKLVTRGYDVVFGSNGCYIAKGDMKLRLETHGSAHYLRLQAGQWNSPQSVFPVVADPILDQEESTQPPQVIRSPVEPSAEERRNHEATHLPFAQWCPVCVEAKSTDVHHRSVDFDERKANQDEEMRAKIQIDYTFLKTGPEEPTIVVLTALDVINGIGGATVVKNKGISDGHPVKWLKAFLEETGHVKLVIQSDPEASIKAVAAKVSEEMKDVKVQETQVHDHRANGAVER